MELITIREGLTPEQIEQGIERGSRLGDAFLIYYNAYMNTQRVRSVKAMSSPAHMESMQETVDNAALLLYRTFIDTEIE